MSYQLKMSNLLNRLAFNEIKSLSLVSKTKPGEIEDKYVPAILQLTDRALREIYTRYPISEKEIGLILQEDQFVYWLRPDYALSSESAEPVKYIDDDMGYGDFVGDIARVISVFDENGRELTINQDDDPYTVFLSQYDQLRLIDHSKSQYEHLAERSYDTAKMFIKYRNLHEPVTVPYGSGSHENDPDTIIRIPPAFQEPLSLLIGSLVYGAINTEVTSYKAAKLHSEYEAALNRIDIDGLGHTGQAPSDSRFSAGGFV